MTASAGGSVPGAAAAAPSGCGALTVSDDAPRASFPRALVYVRSSGRLRLYLRDVTQKSRFTARLSINGRRIDTQGPNSFSCALRGAHPPVNSFPVAAEGRQALRRTPRPRVAVKLVLTNGSGKSSTLQKTLKVRAT